jgi:mono/diheme cytochrome c family protein
VATPERTPSAENGAGLNVTLPTEFRTLDFYRANSPSAAWQKLRGLELSKPLGDAEVWDLVAWLWQSSTTPGAAAEGEKLYAANCAACHGETGAGNGIMAAALSQGKTPMAAMDAGHGTTAPASFADPATMLGASPALLHGKILRGGMGTGMPYFGPVFTEEQIWRLVDYLWTFQFR